MREILTSGLGAGLGTGVSVGARVVLPHPLVRVAATAGLGAATFWLPAGPFRYALLGALVVSGVVDLIHLGSRIRHADMPRGGVRSLEEELARAPSLGGRGTVYAA